ncbi:hypothetical protein GCM10023192_15580 [Amycolatopsis samaneae]
MIAGRYKLRKKLGSGGMGVVWLATDEVLEREVALKCPQLGDKRGARRLRIEARNAARLRHPHIVAVYDVFDEGTTCWLVQEYVEARSLAEIVREDGTLKPRRAAAIGWQIADALAEAHAQGVVHCDVTPENVLVTGDGVAKLTDFGVSRAIWSEITQTDTVAVRGKLPYLAPEVAQGQQAGRESDMFSLGATLFAAVEGHSPLGEADHPAAWVAKAAACEVETPRKAGELASPLTQLLLSDPKRRLDAAHATEAFKKISPPDPKILEWDARWRATSRPPEFERRRVRRRRVLLGATVIVSIAAVAGIVFLLLPRSGAAPAAVPPPVGMGDARTADPCALVSTASMARFGRVTLSLDSGNFDRCDLLVRPREKPVGGVELNLATGPPERNPSLLSRQAGSVEVLSAPADGNHCVRLLGLPDGNRVELTGKKYDPAGPEPCALADGATDYAVEVLNRGPVPRRAAPPATSLASADACGLLEAGALSSVPGIDALHPEAGFGNWRCRWTSTTEHSGGVDLFFDRNQPLTADDGQPVRLAGRAGFVKPQFDGPDDCTVRVQHRPYQDTNGDPMVELVVVKVFGSWPEAQRCAMASTLAAALKLPR